ncbi:FAD-binding domain-containing protein [uncultured Pedobacter sp.]|uniref:FAD-binding domain-containing protein n=1 Tax=uncultured Pedobacter sp. TaxID=246139 RepID=UPI0025CD77EC|nr:FAD-binding domain-containing protein [uncultured Pedobacter sp.]
MRVKKNVTEGTAFTTDYDQVLEQIKHIDPTNYAATRNFINGAVTYLSPYISRGVISFRQIHREVMKKGWKIEECEKFFQELAWREYYQRLWEVRKDLIWQDLRTPQTDVLHGDMIRAIIDARTGITAVDEAINRLYSTGYMHNHVRMYLASIACNIAGAHWLQPSKWMYYHLLDGDIASNNCSWQWVAGAFAPKKYYCNQENINRYTLSVQEGTFLDRPYEEILTMELPGELKERIDLKLSTTLPETLLPAIDNTMPTLIYNSYNLDPEWRKEETANRILLLEPSHFARYPVSEKVIRFIRDLAGNIPGIQVYTGEITDLQSLYATGSRSPFEAFISKNHVAFGHYPGIRDSYEWMFPEVTGEYPSFFAYWKRCKRYL